MSGGNDGGDAADASIEAAEIAAGSQREALDYLKQKESAPSFYSDQALGQLAGFYGLPQAPAYGTGDYVAPTATTTTNQYGQQQFVDQVMNDPFYNSMISQGEDAVLRNQAATGGLRSGTTNEALAQNSQNVLQGLVQDRLSGLGAFTGGSGFEGEIANTISGIGSTTAQGQIAAAQALQQGAANQSQTNAGVGTLIGAGLGSVVPGVGTVLGGAAGGILGSLF